MEIQSYNAAHKTLWDEFVKSSKNATFLFQRSFMDYHSDRFEDASLLVFKKGKPLALLPANKQERIIYSHQGLSYGGLLLPPHISSEEVITIFHTILTYCKDAGFKTLVYKALPHYYYRTPSFEEAYPLFLLKSDLLNLEMNSVIDLSLSKSYQTRRKRRIKKALNENVFISKSNDLGGFWEILETNLITRHQVKPVHTLSEIQLLANRFPDNIQLFVAYLDNELVGGVLIFISQTTIHTQYIAASPEGKRCGALDLTVDHLIDKYHNSHQFLSLGVSSNRKTQTINKGLKEWKEGFGAKDFPHCIYTIDLSKSDLLKHRYQ